VLADRAHEELVATGARPRRLVLSGVDSLTPSERRIAAMAAEGLANREIAQALFVTLRTVEMHLSNAFRKLDISSRTQLPAALASTAARPHPPPHNRRRQKPFGSSYGRYPSRARRPRGDPPDIDSP
jgi:DNA-binding CsgD family transcriptional regulator